MTWLTRFLGARPDPQAAEKILALACPLCGALPGEPCDPEHEVTLAVPPCGLCGNPARCPAWCDAAAGITVLGGDPLTVLHTGRVLAAIRGGLVREEGVQAQFKDGREPHSLTKANSDQEART